MAERVASGSLTNMSEIESKVSLIGGVGLILFGLTRRSLGGLFLSLVGGAALYRGATTHCPIYEALGVSTAEKDAPDRAMATSVRSLDIRKAVTINRPVEELYQFWRKLENLPRFMKHLESVSQVNNKRSHWIAKAPAGMTVEWYADIVDEKENELISWRSLYNVDVHNEGTVLFTPAPAGRGTEVRVSLKYNPPFGIVGSAFAKLFGEEPSQQIEEDLRRFKQIAEAGEIASVTGQPQGNQPCPEVRQDLQKKFGGKKRDIVEEASWESFLASDPPAW
jgi:uncharacterized membrane protein